jgi:hypothetical protein
MSHGLRIEVEMLRFGGTTVGDARERNVTPMKLSFRSGIWVCYGAGLFVSGCSSRSARTTEQTAALTAAEVRWKQSGLSDYSFEIHTFAPLTLGQNAATIEVRGASYS